MYGKVVNGGFDYMDGRDDALDEIRIFIRKMKVTEPENKSSFGSLDTTHLKMLHHRHILA